MSLPGSTEVSRALATRTLQGRFCGFSVRLSDWISGMPMEAWVRENRKEEGILLIRRINAVNPDTSRTLNRSTMPGCTWLDGNDDGDGGKSVVVMLMRMTGREAHDHE